MYIYIYIHVGKGCRKAGNDCYMNSVSDVYCKEVGQ